jgi:hypothetical protein
MADPWLISMDVFRSRKPLLLLHCDKRFSLFTGDISFCQLTQPLDKRVVVDDSRVPLASVAASVTGPHR